MPAIAPRAPRTLTAVPNSAAPHNGNGQVHTHERAQSCAQRDVADNAALREPARRDVDQAAIQRWLPVAETIVGDAARPQGPDRIRVAHADALTLDELGGALAAA